MHASFPLSIAYLMPPTDPKNPLPPASDRSCAAASFKSFASKAAPADSDDATNFSSAVAADRTRGLIGANALLQSAHDDKLPW